MSEEFKKLEFKVDLEAKRPFIDVRLPSSDPNYAWRVFRIAHESDARAIYEALKKKFETPTQPPPEWNPAGGEPLDNKL